MSSPAAADTYAPGATVGEKYRLERKLGEGGMGSVWAAHHEKLDTAVAIKLIRGEANRQDLALRLVQEARAAAKLGHPAIVRVFDVGQTEQGDPFIVMELLEGESLHQRLLREERIPATEAVQLLLPIADALRAAHGKGIVHRDIKPDNVFLASDTTSSDGGGLQPKLVDFGIAKLAARDMDSQLTQKGAVLGSPDYMSPEQARGEDDIDYRADIWSFCVLLYEVVSGQPPFDGANYNALLRAIVETHAPSLEELCAADSELSTIITTGMAKARADRWPSMQALGEALALWLLKQNVFEDVAGGSVEAKWILRRSDPGGTRQSRPSFSTLPGLGRTGRGTTTGRRRAAEAPTSVGPVVTSPGLRAGRRMLVPGVVAGSLALLGFGWWRASADSPPPVTAQQAPFAVQAAPAPTLNVPPPPALEPRTSSTPPEPRPRAVESKPGKARPRAPAPTPSARSETKAKAGLDLMTPY